MDEVFKASDEETTRVEERVARYKEVFKVL